MARVVARLGWISVAPKATFWRIVSLTATGVSAQYRSPGGGADGPAAACDGTVSALAARSVAIGMVSAALVVAASVLGTVASAAHGAIPGFLAAGIDSPLLRWLAVCVAPNSHQYR